MPTPPRESDASNFVDDPLAGFDETLDRIAQLAAEAPDEVRLARGLLGSLQAQLACEGAVVWASQGDGSLTVIAEINLGPCSSPHDLPNHQQHRDLLAEVLASREPAWVDSQGGETPALAAPNPSRFPLLLAPMRLPSGDALVEVFHRVDAEPAACSGALQFLAAAVTQAEGFRPAPKLAVATLTEDPPPSAVAVADQSLLEVHGSLDPREASAAVANSGRFYVGCDRLSVCRIESGRGTLVAMSGVATVDARSDAVRALVALAASAADEEGPVWFGWQPDSPEHCEEAWSRYSDLSSARSLGVVPLLHAGVEEAERPTLFGALLVEQFRGLPDQALAERTIELARHASIALWNAEVHDAIPFGRTLSRFGSVASDRSARRGWVAAALLAAAFLACLVLVPAELRVAATGEARPAARQHVFAPSDAEVRALRVETGDRVQAGDVLLELSDPALDQEYLRVVGELNAYEKKLSAVLAARADTRDADESMRLSAEEAEYRTLLDSTKKQRAILDQRYQALEVRSPISGTVITWDADRRLRARPVRRGQNLLTVADLDGPWELELRIEDDRLGHVREALRQSSEGLRASYALATDPDQQRSGVVREVSPTTDAGGPDAPPSAAVRVDIDATGDELRPGATVMARIDCGTRSLGYVWLHDIWNALRTWWLY